MGHLRALERKEVIERIPGQARTFRINRPDAPEMNEIPEDATEVVDIPVMGDIAAGYPDRVEPAGEIGRLQVDIANAGYSVGAAVSLFRCEVIVWSTQKFTKGTWLLLSLVILTMATS